MIKSVTKVTFRRALLDRQRVLDPVDADAERDDEVCSPTCTPSAMKAARSRPSSRRDISFARAVSVAATNRREAADFDAATAASSITCPAGSSPARSRRDDNPASIFSGAVASAASESRADRLENCADRPTLKTMGELLSSLLSALIAQALLHLAITQSGVLHQSP
jgi:hypothetical protein